MKKLEYSLAGVLYKLADIDHETPGAVQAIVLVEERRAGVRRVCDVGPERLRQNRRSRRRSRFRRRPTRTRVYTYTKILINN